MNPQIPTSGSSPFLVIRIPLTKVPVRSGRRHGDLRQRAGVTGCLSCSSASVINLFAPSFPHLSHQGAGLWQVRWGQGANLPWASVFLSVRWVIHQHYCRPWYCGRKRGNFRSNLFPYHTKRHRDKGQGQRSKAKEVHVALCGSLGVVVGFLLL